MLCITHSRGQFCNPDPEFFVGCDPVLHQMDAQGPFILNIFTHAIRDNNGNGGVTYEQVETSVGYLNEVFNPEQIFFRWDCNVNDINNTTWFNTSSPSGSNFFSEQNTAYTSTRDAHPNGINIFIFPDQVNTGEGCAKLPGKAMLVAGNYFDAPYPAFSRSKLIAHEMGHCLGLLHTHHTTSGDTDDEEELATADELVNGGNCETAGDCVCDTPADPIILNEVFHPSCLWLGWTPQDVDANGDNYQPDPTNIMSYTHPSCMGALTPGQGKRARNMIATQEMLQQALAQQTITSSETWDLNSIPGGIVTPVGDICVEPGATLIIEGGITVKFNPNARLIIKPNASVFLYGTLTNNPCGGGECPGECGDTWKGVEVWGNSSQHQETVNGVRFQGRLMSRKGAIIENAQKGAQLWGPDQNTNTGGIISCYKTTFRNNDIGVEILPYENFAPTNGVDKPYRATFSLCSFLTDANYPHPASDFAFISMAGVRGVSIKGSSFLNTFTNPTTITDITSFGYGISAVSSSYTVEPGCKAPVYPCTEYINSSFIGLGYGIANGTTTTLPATNLYANILEAEFEDCYVGIGNDAMPNVSILASHFTMGALPDTSLTVNQFGVESRSITSGLNIQQNIFTQPAPNTGLNTVGVSCYNLGFANQRVRNNRFDGLTVGNMASRNNGGDNSGLLYLCNTNTNNTAYDFLLCPGTVDNQKTRINEQQKAVENDIDIASGNRFSNSATTSDRDFSNTIVANNFELNYYHKINGGTIEVPDEYSGIFQLTESPPNSCATIYCPPPCNDEFEIAGIKDDFFEYRASRDTAYAAYQNAQNNGDTVLAAQKRSEVFSYRQLMDEASQAVLIYLKMDTTALSLDSLRTWLSLSETYAAELELALSYFNHGDFTTASSVLANIPQKFKLSGGQLSGLNDMQSLFSQLQGKSVLNLSVADLNYLQHLALDNYSMAGGIATNTLRLYGYPPPHPDYCNLSTGGAPEPTNVKDNKLISSFIVFPNPANRIINFEASVDLQDELLLRVFNITGQLVHATNITASHQWDTVDVPNGIYIYQLQTKGELLQTGRIVVQH
jgi:hypothetical protein